MSHYLLTVLVDGTDVETFSRLLFSTDRDPHMVSREILEHDLYPSGEWVGERLEIADFAHASIWRVEEVPAEDYLILKKYLIYDT